MARNKIGFTALLVAAAFASGCATVETSGEKSSSAAKAAATETEVVEVGYITGSRLKRKASQNTQGVTQTSPYDWRQNLPPAPLKGD